MEFSNRYIVLFTIVVSLVCAFGVSSMAVALKEPQAVNRELDRKANVLRVAGLLPPGEKLTKERSDELFKDIVEKVIDRTTGEVLEGVDPRSVNPFPDSKDPSKSDPVPSAYRLTQVAGMPKRLLIYEVNAPGHECLILPIWGNGLWSTLFGYLAVAKDASRTLGITYYQHAETPGLGGEVDSVGFKKQFSDGKQLYDEAGRPLISVVKAGTSVDDKKHFQVDGLSGATITGNGVHAMLQLWLSEHGYGKYLQARRTNGT